MALTPDHLEKVLLGYLDKHRIKRPIKITKDAEGGIAITFNKTAAYRAQPVSGWSNISARLLNWVTSSDNSFDPRAHQEVIAGSLQEEKPEAPLPTIEVVRSKMTFVKSTLFGTIHLPWTKRGTHLRSNKMNKIATQPVDVTLRYSRELLEDKNINATAVIKQFNKAGICNDVGHSTSKRNTYNPFRRLILACTSPFSRFEWVRKLNNRARSIEIGKGFEERELNVPMIETGFFASAANIFSALGGAAAIASTAGGAAAVPVVGAIGAGVSSALAAGSAIIPASASAAIVVGGGGVQLAVTSHYRNLDNDGFYNDSFDVGHSRPSTFFATTTKISKVEPKGFESLDAEVREIEREVKFK